MAGCATTEVLTLGAVRSYIQIPDPRTCNRKTLYYGQDCQLMEVDGVTRNVRNAGTPIRTWNRRRRTYCTIGTTETPPDNPQVTLRFYEACGRGLPLPHTLGDCRVRVINNYGLCKSSGTLTTGWSSYAEVLDLNILSENRGRRSSYDGADDALTDEITAELLNVYDISTVQFEEIDLTNLTCAVGGGGVFDDVVFGCYVGCGGRSCDCNKPCDDGSYTFYVPASCAGGATQFVIYSKDGGETVNTSILPAATGGGTAATYPKIAVIGNTLYAMAYQNPPELFSITIDENGDPDGNWQLEAILNLDANGNTVTTGIPARLVIDGDYLHVLVEDATAGSRVYTLGGNRVPTEGARTVFPIAQDINDMAACGDQLVAVGDAAAIQFSSDGGASWHQLDAPPTFVADITSVWIHGGRVWIGAAGGVIYNSADEGDSWSKVTVPGVTGTVNDIQFLGDDIGWLADTSGRPVSTWIGGLNNADWTRDTQRVYGWDVDVTPLRFAIPACAASIVAANTVLIAGTNAAGESTLHIGRAPVTGI